MNITIESEKWKKKNIKLLLNLLDNASVIDNSEAKMLYPGLLITFENFGHMNEKNLDKIIKQSINKIITIINESASVGSKLIFRFNDKQRECGFFITMNNCANINYIIDGMYSFFKSRTKIQEHDFFYFNNQTLSWEDINDRVVEFTVTSIFLKANVQIQMGRSDVYMYLKSDLEQIAHDFHPAPVAYESDNRPIGKTIKMWMDGDTLYNKVCVFKDVDEEMKKDIKNKMLFFGFVAYSQLAEIEYLSGKN